MNGEKVVNTFGWHDQEVVGAGLPDKRLARRLHRHELACIWWQLLSALAPLEDFVPRTAGFQRVRMGDGHTSHAASASYTTIRRRRRASRRDRLGAAGRSRNHSK